MNAPVIATARYVVLSESEQSHLVALRYPGHQWMLIVAAFVDPERARSYADLENQFIGDEHPAWPSDVAAKPPKQGDPGSSLAKAIAARAGKGAAAALPAPSAPAKEKKAPKPQKVASAAKPEPKADTEPRTRAPKPGAEERNQRLRELWSTDLSIVKIAERIGVSEARVYQLKKELNLPERAKVVPAKAKPEPRPEPAAAPPPPQPAAKKATPPPTGGEEFSKHGVDIGLTREHEFARVGDKAIDLTPAQASLMVVLLKAAPNPVGIPFIISRIYPSVPKEQAEIRLSSTAGDLEKELPRIGLHLNNMKAVGLSLGGLPE